MASMLTAVPTYFFAGDTVAVAFDHASYPAPDWDMKLALNGPEIYEITAEDSGTGHVITFNASNTGSRIPGSYFWAAYYTKDGERYTEETGSVFIRANPSSAVTTWEEETLVLIRAHIKGRLPAGLASHTIAGTAISKISLREAMDIEANLAMRVQAIIAARNPEVNNNVYGIEFAR